MHHSLSIRARGVVLAAIFVALNACDDHSNLNSPSPRPHRDIQAQVDTSSSFIISDVRLASTRLVIDGAPAIYTAILSAPTEPPRDWVVRYYFVQQQVRHAASFLVAPCSYVTPTCTYSAAVRTPRLLPGPAIFELQLVDAFGHVLSTRDIDVTLVAGQTISALNLSSTSLVVGGASTSYRATLQNPAPSLSGVAIQGWLVQSGTNNARRATGESVVQCGSGLGILPNGSCTLSSVLVASNTSAGTGTLIPGSATFELDLTVNGVLFAQETVPVSIKAVATITALSLDAAVSDTVLLEGAGARYSATLRNFGSSLSGISIQGWVTQGTARRFAGGMPVSCGSSSGVVPNGSCTLSSQLAASNNTSGAGTLITGVATFELQLVDALGTVLSTATIPLYVIDGPLESPPVGPSTDNIVLTKKARTRSP